jgi:hypoxanthine phosphoribosyltransferase
MADPASASAWETWESVFLKTTALGDRIIEQTLSRGQHITRIAFVPRGGLYLANVLSRMLGLSGDQTISLGISKYDREHPMQAGDFKIGQLPDASQVADQIVLLVDEVHDSGRTAEWARNALVELGAAAVLMAVIHYKPGANATGYEPDFYIEAINGWSTTRGSLSTCSAASIRPLCESNPGKGLDLGEPGWT